MIEYENIAKFYPQKFNVTKCLSTDRTFPQNKSTVKAPVEMKTHIELIKEKFKP